MDKINLYDVNTSDVMNVLVNDVMEYCNVKTKKLAKALVLNALLANVVSEDIINQVNFLIENGGYSDYNNTEV